MPAETGGTLQSKSAQVSGQAKSVTGFAQPHYADVAERAVQEGTKYSTLASSAQESLDLLKQGMTLPEGHTQQDLIHRIDVGHAMTDAYTTMATWANDPYNLTKLKEAKTAQQDIVQTRRELESLRTANGEELNAFRRGKQSFYETEAGRKVALANATAEAQTRFAALLPANQHSQSAATIARAVEQATGQKVLPEDIMKGKEKRDPGEAMTADQSANLVIKTA